MQLRRAIFSGASRVLVVVAEMAAAADAVVAGSVRIDATFEHLGVVWWITGDDDLDSTFTLEFRLLDEARWRPAAPATRAHPALPVDGSPLGLSYWAASALFLWPGGTHELRLMLSDPDGGSEIRILEADTRSRSPATWAGRDRYVVPGSSGGDGSASDPFRGLQSAADSALPGDVLHVAPGTNAPVQVLTSGAPGRPIVFLGPLDGSTLVDGAGASRGILTLGEWDQILSHVVIEGLSLENGHRGIDAQHTREVVIRHNTIRDVDYGVVNRRGEAQEGNQLVCDNEIRGVFPGPVEGFPRSGVSTCGPWQRGLPQPSAVFRRWFVSTAVDRRFVRQRCLWQ